MLYALYRNAHNALIFLQKQKKSNKYSHKTFCKSDTDKEWKFSGSSPRGPGNPCSPGTPDGPFFPLSAITLISPGNPGNPWEPVREKTRVLMVISIVSDSSICSVHTRISIPALGKQYSDCNSKRSTNGRYLLLG